MDRPSPAAVLVTGVYGTGKTAVVEEMAAILERADAPFAAIDLDWLAWANLDDHGPESDRVLLANLTAVVATYREAGMSRFVLAGSVEGPMEAHRLARAIGMPMSVVRLTLVRDAGSDLGDLVVTSDRPIGQVADEILAWLSWIASG